MTRLAGPSFICTTASPAKQRAGEADRFSPHALRRACDNYERGMDLVGIQRMLGRWQIGTTMRYVSPSSTFMGGYARYSAGW